MTRRTVDTCDRCGRSPVSEDCDLGCGVSFCHDCWERRRDTCIACGLKLALLERDGDSADSERRPSRAGPPASPLIDGYRRHLEAEQRRSPNTVRAYVGTVQRLAESRECAAAGGLDGMTETDLSAYLASFRSVNRPATRARRLSALRSFYRYRQNLGAIAEEPTARLPRHEPASSLPTLLSVEECVHLIELRAPDTRHVSALLSRDRAIFDVLYVTGITLEELTALDTKDLSPRRQELRVRDREDGERVVNIPPPTLDSLLAYLELWRIDLSSGLPLFLNAKDNRLSERAIWKIVQKRLKQAGITRPAGLHALRHSCASHLCDADNDDPPVAGCAALLSRFPSTQTFRAGRGFCGEL